MPLMIHSIIVGVYHIDYVTNTDFRYHQMNFPQVVITEESLSATFSYKYYAID